MHKLQSKELIIEAFQRLSASMPDPKIELDYTTEFNFLCAVIMSAQSTDKQVNKAEIHKFISTPYDAVNLGINGIMKIVSSINYYRNKSKFVYNSAKIIIEKFNGSLPYDIDSLCSLPGVGRKTANVFLNEIKSAPTIGIDTHIIRTVKRIGISLSQNPIDIENDLLNIFRDKDSSFIRNVHRWLVLHGRYICKARKPLCGKCVINDLCLRQI